MLTSPCRLRLELIVHSHQMGLPFLKYGSIDAIHVLCLTYRSQHSRPRNWHGVQRDRVYDGNRQLHRLLRFLQDVDLYLPQ